MSTPPSDITNLPYNELRKLAKQLGIKANQKADKLRSEILAHPTKPASPDALQQSTRLSCSSQVDDSSSNHQADVFSNEDSSSSSPALLTFQNITKRSVPVISPKLDSLEEIVTEDEEEVDSLSEESTSSTGQVLNRTYELTEPTMLVNAPELIPDCAVSSHLTNVDVGEFKSTVALVPTATLGNGPCGNDRKETHSQLLPSKQPSSVRAVPDFSRIHAATAARMETLVEFAARRQRMREQTVQQQPASAPFASPLRRNTMPHRTASSRVTGALGDFSNRPVGRDNGSSGSPGASGGGEKSISALGRSNSVLVGVQRSTSSDIKSSTIDAKTTAAVSAFARRKAYDRRQRLSAGTLTSILGGRSNENKDPRSSQTAKFVAGQLQRNLLETKQARVQARQTSVDAHRGLL